MASIGHIAVGMACGRALGGGPARERRAMVALSIVSLLPDADAAGFLVGIHYGDSLGHRGATHSIAFALFIALASYVFAKRRALAARRVALFTVVAALSHPVLDTMTTGGGLGCALLWPFSDTRFWAPLRFIPIAPIGIRLVSARGLYVMLSEVVIFAPLWLYALWPRRRADKPGSPAA